MNQQTPNREDWLDETLHKLANNIEWCVEVRGAVPVDRYRETNAINEAKAQILAHYAPKPPTKGQPIVTPDTSDGELRDKIEAEVRKYFYLTGYNDTVKDALQKPINDIEALIHQQRAEAETRAMCFAFTLCAIEQGDGDHVRMFAARKNDEYAKKLVQPPTKPKGEK